MIKIAEIVEEILIRDDIAFAAAQSGWLNLSSYARNIKTDVEERLLKPVQTGSIVTALSRLIEDLPKATTTLAKRPVQSLIVHSSLEGMTYERHEHLSEEIRKLYHTIKTTNKTYLTVTQGLNEITIIAEARVAQQFRKRLGSYPTIYDKNNLIGITVKFDLGHLEIPNLIFALTRRLSYKNINIIEIVSTATELTYILEKKDLAIALEQLQKEV